MQLSSLRPDDVSSASAPLIDGPSAYLWSGAGAVMLIMTLVLYVLLRTRAGRRPRITRAQAAATEYFQPAGEDAEITFEDARAAQAHAAPAGEATAEPAFAPSEPSAPRVKKPGPFAGLFARRKREDGEGDAGHAAAPAFDAAGDVAAVSIERGAAHEPSLDEPVDAPRSPFAERREPRADTLDWRERVVAEPARFEAERARAAEFVHEERAPYAEQRWEPRRFAEEAAAPEPPTWPAPAHADAPSADFVARTLSEVEEALHAQSDTIKFETRAAIDQLGRRLEGQIAALGAAIEQIARDAPEGARDDRSALVRDFSDAVAEHRMTMSAQLRALGERLDAFDATRREAAEQRAHPAYQGPTVFAAPEFHLADVVRDCLPPAAYQLNAALSNNRRADCLIRLPHPLAPIAIDARFPVEAFQLLEERREEADNEFRRIALRHIVDIAERLIAPTETADAALMFTPSETMFAAMQARFPDVVQDAYRARVWIVSPTSLMATLNAIRAVVGDPRQRQAIAVDAGKALAEVDMLRERVARLEVDFDRARRDVNDIASGAAATALYRREHAAPPAKPPEAPSAPAVKRDAGDAQGDLGRDAQDRGEARAPFPLR